MNYILLKFLKNHYQQLPGDAGRRLMLYIAFLQRFCKKSNIEISWENCELEGLLSRLFQKVNGYDIKEAAVTFELAMPWSILQRNSQLSDDFKYLNSEIYKSGKATSEWLSEQVEILFNYDNTDNFTVTPYCVRELVSKLAFTKQVFGIVDICCGTFSLGLHIWKEVSQCHDVYCEGEEISNYLCAISKLLLFLCDVKQFAISERNVLNSNEEYKKNNNNAVVYVGDLPLAGNRTVPPPKKSKLIPPDFNNTLYTDWFIIQDVLGRMKNGDSAFFLVTKGALVRKNECEIRKKIIEEDLLDAVIHIPSGIYPNQYFSMELLVFEKNREDSRKGNVFIADMSDFALKKNDKKTLALNGIYRIQEQLFRFYGDNKVSRIVSSKEIQSKEYSLSPNLYFEEAKALRGGMQLKEIATVTRGIQNYQGEQSGERLLLNVRDIRDNKIFYDNADRIDIKRMDWESKYRIKEDDIVITCKGSVLKVAIVSPNPPPAYISGNLTIIRVDPKKYSPYLLYEYLLSERGQTALSLIQTGTTIRILGNRNLEQLLIPSYDNKISIMLGNSLKLAAIKYDQSLHKIVKEYEDEKKNILNQLKESEEV